MSNQRESGREILTEQQTYYRERASEYDDFVLRRGKYDEGADENRRWFAEVDEVKAALAAFDPAGDVLELAAGTGWWTPQLVPYADHVTALDGSPEVLEINRQRVPAGAPVEYVVGDIFRWAPDRLFDVVFFGFWLSHVPPPLFEEFWGRVRSFLKPDGRVFFVDSLQPATAAMRANPHESEISVRRLNDGREYRIVKIFYEPDDLQQRLRALGWDAHVRSTGTFFVYGSAARP
jgi:demethylmenaquinone methyltransferase/2-methoxy-6-polyprenyl-1,4-benzoquinol methylase